MTSSTSANSAAANRRKPNARQQNLCNTRPRGGRSQYKGVRYDKRRNKWIAEITCQGKKYYLGSFTTEIEAARAYDTRARELFGPYARLNFPHLATPWQPPVGARHASPPPPIPHRPSRLSTPLRTFVNVPRSSNARVPRSLPTPRISPVRATHASPCSMITPVPSGLFFSSRDPILPILSIGICA